MAAKEDNMMKNYALASLIVAICALSASAATVVRFTQGVTKFTDGDVIAITEVLAEKATFDVGDTITVKGTYTLASHANAKILLSVTQDVTKALPVEQGHGIARKEVEAGTGDFEMTISIPYEGWVHLGFYDTDSGKPFGNLYFGTKEQMDKIADWDLEKRFK